MPASPSLPSGFYLRDEVHAAGFRTQVIAIIGMGNVDQLFYPLADVFSSEAGYTVFRYYILDIGAGNSYGSAVAETRNNPRLKITLLIGIG